MHFKIKSMWVIIWLCEGTERMRKVEELMLSSGVVEWQALGSTTWV